MNTLMNTPYRPLAIEELYALEHRARRERAATLAALFNAGAQRIKQAYAALAERAQGATAKVARHA